MVEIKSKKEEARILSAEKHGSDLLFYAMFFIAMTLLAFLFPPTVVDDLAWATETGWSRLENGFDGYNGRYLSNLLAIALVRVPALLPFVKSFTVTGIIFFIQKISRNKSKGFLILSAIYFAVPTTLFIQDYVWTSAFVNYYISVLITMVNFYLLFYKTNLNKIPNFLKCVCLLVLGVAGQLFVETNSILCLVVAVGALVYFGKKDKRFDTASAIYTVACIVGCIIMFSNSAYTNIMNNNDSYRDVSVGKNSMVQTVISWLYKLTGEVALRFFSPTYPVIVTIIILCLIIQKKKKILSRRDVVFLVSFSAACAIAAVAVVATVLIKSADIQIARLAVGLLLLAADVFLCLSVWRLEDDKKKKLIAVYIAMIMLQVAPFIVVSPVGQRCFSGAYVLMILIAKELMDELEIRADLFAKAGTVVLAVVLAFNIFCYSQAYISHGKKIETIKSELAKGNYEVTLEHTSFGFMLYSADCENHREYFKKYFCDYYGFPYEIELTYK